MATTYWVNDEPLAQGADDLYVSDLGGFATSAAYGCPRCGKLWGRRESSGRSWGFWTVGCEAHSNQFGPGGSFWPRIYEKKWGRLPEPVLHRELTLHLNWAEKGAIEMTPILEDQIRVWRQKVIENTLTEDEMIKIVENLRQGRMAAQQAATSSKAKGKKPGPVVDGNSLLDEMMAGDI